MPVKFSSSSSEKITARPFVDGHRLVAHAPRSALRSVASWYVSSASLPSMAAGTENASTSPFDVRLGDEVLQDGLDHGHGHLLARVQHAVRHRAPHVGVEHVGELLGGAAVDDQLVTLVEVRDLVLVERALRELGVGDGDERVQLRRGLDLLALARAAWRRRSCSCPRRGRRARPECRCLPCGSPSPGPPSTGGPCVRRVRRPSIPPPWSTGDTTPTGGDRQDREGVVSGGRWPGSRRRPLPRGPARRGPARPSRGRRGPASPAGGRRWRGPAAPPRRPRACSPRRRRPATASPMTVRSSSS